MIKLVQTHLLYPCDQLSLTIVATLFNADCVEHSWHAPPCDHLSEIFGWTEWFDLDNPSGNGDFEFLEGVQTLYPGRVCNNPVDIEVRTLSGLSLAEAGEQILRNEVSAFECWNRDQPDSRCNDYKVRYSCPPTSSTLYFGWTQWFDLDNPSGNGDFEFLEGVQTLYPGRICNNPVDIEVRTLSGLSLAEAGEQILRNEVSGFECWNRYQPDNRCNDYKVRYYCPPNLCWTMFFNRDRPNGEGDSETLADLRAENPGKICDNPLYIQAVTTDTMTLANNTGQTFFTFNPTEGFVCRNKDQTSGICKDYGVRFVCPCVWT